MGQIKPEKNDVDKILDGLSGKQLVDILSYFGVLEAVKDGITRAITGEKDTPKKSEETPNLPAVIPAQNHLLDANALIGNIEGNEALQDNVKNYLKRIINDFLEKFGDPADFDVLNITAHIIRNKLTNKKAQDYVKALILRFQDVLLYLVSELKDLEGKNYVIGMKQKQGDRSYPHNSFQDKKVKFGLLAIQRDIHRGANNYKPLCGIDDWDGESEFLYNHFENLLEGHTRGDFKPIAIAGYNDASYKSKLPTFDISVSGTNNSFIGANEVYGKIFEGLVGILEQLRVSPDLISAYEDTDEYEAISTEEAILRLNQ